MTTVGETLRRERLKRNLALDEVSRELKISPRLLEAIEDEEFQKLPGGVFARAFVRQYGSLLGLNGEELAAQLQESLEPPVFEVSEPPRSVRTGIAPIQVPRMEEWQSVGDQRFRWSGSLSAAIVVVVVMLVCSAVYAWLQRPRNPVSAHNNPTPVQTAVPGPSLPPSEPVAVATGPAPVQNPVVTPSAAPPAPKIPPAPKTEVAPTSLSPRTASSLAPNPGATVRLEITAGEPVWILARSDGKFVFTGTMEARETRTVEGVRDVVLRLGNAGGVTITLNGKAVGPVGPKGQPRTVQFTSGGFQIVPAAKPPFADPAPIERL